MSFQVLTRLALRFMWPPYMTRPTTGLAWLSCLPMLQVCSLPCCHLPQCRHNSSGVHPHRA